MINEGKNIRCSSDFLAEFNARGLEMEYVFQILMGNKCEFSILYPVELTSKYEGPTQATVNIQDLRE